MSFSGFVVVPAGIVSSAVVLIDLRSSFVDDFVSVCIFVLPVMCSGRV